MKRIFFLCSFVWFMGVQATQFPHYYVTAADDRYYPQLLNLIGSIHKNDYANVGMIAVFDLGLTQEQRGVLRNIQRVALFDVELVHPHLLTPYRADNGARLVRGWFAWKPVILKQALDMFPYIIYVDAGTTILKPMDAIFAHIRAQGYLFFDTGHPIAPRMTHRVKQRLEQTANSELCVMINQHNATFLDAGFQGLSRAVYHTYVLPLYECVADLTLFMDDGSAPLGFGQARHDQTLFSIFAHKNGYQFFAHGWVMLAAESQYSLTHIHWNKQELNACTAVYRSRSDINLNHYASHIRLLTSAA